MTNNIQQSASGVVVRFLLNEEETGTWKSQGWTAAAVRGGVKRQARALFRDTGRAVVIQAASGDSGDREVLWSSETDTVCAQILRRKAV